MSGDASKRVLRLRASAPEPVPQAMPTDVPAVVDMAADMDMDIEALLEKLVEELGMLTTMILVILCSTTEGNSMRGVSSPATALHIARPFSTTSAYTSSSAIFAGMKGGKNADCLHILDSDLSRNTHDTCSR